MKKIYLLLALLPFCSNLSAQVLNIPDPYFKQRLLMASSSTEFAKDINGVNIAIDANGNGEIEISEAQNVYQLFIDNAAISNLTGIQYFTNVFKLDSSNNQLTTFDTVGLESLTYLDVSSNNITSLDLSALVNLEIFLMAYADVTSLDFTVCPNLEEIYCYFGALQSINVAGLTNLRNLTVNGNQISTLDLSGLANLEYLNCGANGMTSINLSGVTSLQDFVGYANLYSTIDLSDLTSLVELALTGSNLTSINFTGLTNLYGVNINSNNLNAIIVDGTSNIVNLHCDSNHLTSLDLSNFVNLGFVSLQNNMLQSLNLKNGRAEGAILNGNPYLNYICCDDVNITQTQNHINNLGYTNCVLNSYCSFVPGGTYYTLEGTNRYINTGAECSGGTPYPHLKFNISNGTTSGSVIANSTSQYVIPVDAGMHTITPVLENPEYYSVSPPSVSATFPVQSSPQAQDFCIAALAPSSDVEVSILPLMPARPGFPATYKVIYKNKGNQIESGTVKLIYADAFIDITSASPQYDSQGANEFNWTFTSLAPFETRQIFLQFSVNTPTATPAVNIGDQLNFRSIIYINNDVMTRDNDFTLKQIVVGSYDPNDKTCLQGTSVGPTMIGNYIHYLIRFENTGTYPAENIVVKDMIDISKFNVSTIVPLSSSHPFTTRITSGNKVEFIFENINLPFDDANNDGYIAFKIKTLSSLSVGDVLSNSASIYFDYNFPIVTNTTSTVINMLGVDAFSFSDAVSLYPVPTQNTLNVHAPDVSIKSMAIYNAIGQQVIAILNGHPHNSIDVSALKSGTYFIRITTDKGSSTGQFIKL